MKRSFLLFVLAMGAGWSLQACLEATQVTFRITTDIPCDQLGNIAITVGVEGETERGTPVRTVKSCEPNGTVAAVGTYAVFPKSREVVASFKVVLAVDPGVKLETDCTPNKGYRGCIVARRRLTFVTHRSLTVPVEMLLSCKNVQCDPNTTCSRNGRCVSNLVDTSKCDADYVCSDLTGDPVTMVSCKPPLVCSGETPWCNYDMQGGASCGAVSIPTPLSFECRTGRDCGPFFRCAYGDGLIMGRCVVDFTATGVVLCLPDDPTACPAGPRACTVDAGGGFLACSLDGGAVTPIDSGVRDGGGADGGFDAGAGVVGTGLLFAAEPSPVSVLAYPLAWTDSALTFGTPVRFPLSIGSSPRSMQITADHRVLLANDNGRVVVLLADAGTWTENQSFLATAVRHPPGRVALHPNERYVYVTADCAQTQNTAMLILDAGTGLLEDNPDPNNPTVNGKRCTGSIGNPDGVAFSRDGRRMYIGGVALESSSIDLQTGYALPVGPKVGQTNSGEVALMQNETVFFTVERGVPGGMTATRLDGGDLDPATLVSAVGPPGASELAVEPDGRHVWVVAYNDFSIPDSGTALWGATVEANGALVSAEVHDFGSKTGDVVVLPDGRWVLVSLPEVNAIAWARLDGDGGVGAWTLQPGGASAPGTLLFSPQ